MSKNNPLKQPRSGNWRCHAFLAVFAAFVTVDGSFAATPDHLDVFAGQPRVFVLTDIGNEPDDQMSLVRLLMYSNEFELEGLVATTSTWQREKIQPQTIHEVIAAYGQVRANLLLHAPGWPDEKQLHARVSSGQPSYGMAAVGSGKMTAGATALTAAVDRHDERPLFVSVWGGANTLAQSLTHVRATRTPVQVAAFAQKIRVYSISDQDDAGPWIRREFPELHYIVKPTPPNATESAYATWTGISGDVFYRNCLGADPTTVTNEWLETNIRKGPLGKHYPRFAYIMEGDTPAFLGLTNNGLASFQSPSFGGWGGRYLHMQPYGETHAFWTQGGDLSPRVTSQDTVTGIDGKTYVSDQATIWRWRNEFQNDFAARMDWTTKTFAQANHNPRLAVDGAGGTAPIYIAASEGDTLALDATASSDPDNDALEFRWFHYAEAGFVPGQNLSDIEIAQPTAAKTAVRITHTCRANWLRNNRPCSSGVAHIILAVTDDGRPRLTSYRRVIVSVKAPAARSN